MPKAVKSISTPTIGRRRLGAGLLAIATGSVLTSGIAAGAAASVADLMPSNPDARLIALCDRYVQADLEHMELCGRQDTIADVPAKSAEWNRLDDLVLEQGLIMAGVEDEIVATRATSPAGVEAKARVVAQVTRFMKDNSGGTLVRSLLGDLLPAGRA